MHQSAMAFIDFESNHNAIQSHGVPMPRDYHAVGGPCRGLTMRDA